MKQFAVIGLGPFGCRVVDEMVELGSEIILLDRDREVIDRLKDKVHAAYIVDVMDEEVIIKLIPADIDAVILDLGTNLEATILVTNYLKKIGVEKIVVKADSDRHGEILSIVGAAHVIYPDLEAARRVTPLLVSDTLYNFMPISSGLVMAEIIVPSKYVGKTLVQANLRYDVGINIVAIKKGSQSEYSFFVPDYVLTTEDILLAVGEEKNIMSFTSGSNFASNNTLSKILKRMTKK
ncbi:MAG: TrkA family potassium uptake protein [Spirochaetaceae bacterium]